VSGQLSSIKRYFISLGHYKGSASKIGDALSAILVQIHEQLESARHWHQTSLFFDDVMLFQQKVINQMIVCQCQVCQCHQKEERSKIKR
jgi:hypothetical protein